MLDTKMYKMEWEVFLHNYRNLSRAHHQRGVLISRPVDYVYVCIYSWECCGEY